MTPEIRIPSILKIGGGSFAEVSNLLLRFGCKRPLIVMDPFMMESGLAGRLQRQIEEAGLSCRIFYETLPDPTSAIVQNGLCAFVAGAHDSLVSLGGGSPIDTAKAIGMLSANPGNIRDFKVPHAPPVAGPVHVAVPTTAGTGSEVTRFTVITDAESQEKILVAGDVLLPTAAVVDFELTLSMPPRLTADTGTDSLTHAIEAFVSRRANPFTDALALAAMKTIWKELPVSFHEPENRQAREAMMLAATQAGIAFSNASVALVHGMSRPIGAHFHVPHGLSNAMLLPAVTAFSVEAALDRYAECARSLGVSAASSTDRVAADQLIRSLYDRSAELLVPSPRQFGIDHARYLALIPTMTAQALASGSPQNNPKIPTAKEIETLYREIWQ